MAIAIAFGTLILLYAAFGYGVDTRGNLYQNGLVFISSTPDAAEVNYKLTSTTEIKKAVTNDKLVLPAGEYSFEMLKQGYRPWQRTIDLTGGGVERLSYPFLFPEKLNTKEVKTYDTVLALTTVSPDRGTLLLQQSARDRTFDMFEINNPETPPSQVIVPQDVITESSKSHSMSFVEWSSDNRHVLLKHSYGKKQEFIILDRRDPASSININKYLDMSPSLVQFRDKNPNFVYVHLSNKKLLSINLRTKASETLADNVLTFKSHGEDELSYIARPDGMSAKKVGVFIIRADETYEVRELPTAPSYFLDMAQFNDRWYVVAGSAEDDNIYIYRDPVEVLKETSPTQTLSIRTIHIKDPGNVSFSANTQFISVQSGQEFAVYDAYADKQYRYKFETQFDKSAGFATWMDGYRLLGSSGGKVIVWDFDGSNYQTLTAISQPTTPIFDEKYEGLYTISSSASTPKSFALTRTELRVQ